MKSLVPKPQTPAPTEHTLNSHPFACRTCDDPRRVLCCGPCHVFRGRLFLAFLASLFVLLVLQFQLSLALFRVHFVVFALVSTVDFGWSAHAVGSRSAPFPFRVPWVVPRSPTFLLALFVRRPCLVLVRHVPLVERFPRVPGNGLCFVFVFVFGLCFVFWFVFVACGLCLLFVFVFCVLVCVCVCGLWFVFCGL